MARRRGTISLRHNLGYNGPAGKYNRSIPLRCEATMNPRAAVWSIACTLVVIATSASSFAQQEAQPSEKLRALIVDGQNNHAWQQTTPLLKSILESSGRFTVEVATTPPARGRGRGRRAAVDANAAAPDMSTFLPKFSDYQVVVSNYNGERWPSETEKAFEAFVAGGGGFVSFHAADNAFPDWPEYNRICGLGGWEGRNEASGPLLYFNDTGELQRDTSPGPGGHHGRQHEFQVRTRDAEHPIMKGLPPLWMHTRDELYDSMRGPAESLHVLATALSDPATGGTGRHEPMLMTIEYGQGRVFHTVLGHADYSVKCVGFVTTFTRGTEWAATGKVTIPIPSDFPGPDTAAAANIATQ
jgi:type 1 glutamine amidotransferase